MEIFLPKEVAYKLTKALDKAGSKEIGGILMGEYISEAVYRIKDLTIQSDGGTYSFFERIVEGISNPLQQFFQKTKYDFTRFNYLGEWHSHPNFAPYPSSTDCKSMWEIVEDSSVGANFAILMIVRLDYIQCLEGTITVFLSGHKMFKGTLIQEEPSS
ncbi:MAG: Mov34/MPN/PAD-1 family protein [Calothrix sp. FI2-JRJ7]|jgi:integrative and conjugative element protein (TIGR02256 family)|nr:Mov34/MPN/PAD-1 family protein [Calothrix sp. FI2-JRJ7]